VVTGTESLKVKEDTPPLEEVKEPMPAAAPSSNAPLSWAARMRSNTGQPMLSPSQMPPLPSSSAAPVPVAPKPKVEQPKAPPSGNGPDADEAAEPVNSAPPQSSGPPHRMNQTREFNSMRGSGGHSRFERDDRDNRPRFQNDDRHQIFVGGLPINMTEENIRSVFSRFGTIKFVRMNQNTNSRPGAGFGFVTFSSEAEAQSALNSRDEIFFNNLQLNIEEKKTKNPDQRGGPHGGHPGGQGGRGGHPGGPHGHRGDSGRGRDGPGRGGGRGQYQSRDSGRPGQRGPPGGQGGPDNYRRDKPSFQQRKNY